MWFLNKASAVSTHSLSKSISKLNKNSQQKEEMEKEWLLLGEPSSPVNRSDQEPLNAESSILSDATASDTDCIVKADNSESDSDEDIDSIVEEFQQKVKVSTAGLKETNLKVPSMGSWRMAMLCMFSVFCCGIVACVSAFYEMVIPFALSIAGKLKSCRFPDKTSHLYRFPFTVVFVMTVIMLWIPRYTYSHDTPAIFTCTCSLLFNSILLSSMLFDSWLAIIFWLVSGIVLAMQSLIKCDVWCCLCLDYPQNPGHQTVLMEESLIPNGSSRLTTATATIRLKNPPIGSAVINHVQSRRWHIDSSQSESEEDYEEDTVEEWTEWDILSSRLINLW